MNTDATARSEDEALEPLYHLDENGHLAWTEEGLRTYRQRFARFGLRIETIATFEAFQAAMNLSAEAFKDQLLAIARNGPPSLERKLLVAIAQGDDAEYRRLFARVEARNRLGLRVIG